MCEWAMDTSKQMSMCVGLLENEVAITLGALQMYT